MARNNPSQFVSIIFDAPTRPAFPNIRPLPKKLARAKVPELYIMGSIMHNCNRRVLQLYGADFGKGADVTISALFWELYNFLKTLPAGTQPPVLLLQLDNASDNKSRWMIAFLCMLCHWNWFAEVDVYFLQPGHTHKDVDQMFSVFETYLHKHTVGSLPDFE